MKSAILKSIFIGLTLGLTVAAADAAPITLADSASEFSGVQGQNGWFYGEYPAANASAFTQLTSFSGTQWNGSEGFGTPYLDATGGHPGNDTLNWVVRRWVSDFSGQVTISGSFFDLDATFDDSANVGILLNGTSILSFLNIPGFAIPYTLTTTLNNGDNLDFIIDPIVSAGGDATYFTATITSPVPIPATVWLFGSGLLGLVGMARRKKAA